MTGLNRTIQNRTGQCKGPVASPGFGTSRRDWGVDWLKREEHSHSPAA